MHNERHSINDNTNPHRANLGSSWAGLVGSRKDKEPMKKIQLQATLEGVSTKKDGSLTVRFSTQELKPEEKVIVMEFLNDFGWLLFASNELKEEEVPKEQAEFKGKTQSARLRNVLYVWFEQLKKEGKTTVDWDKFYREKTEMLIEHIKEKLD